MTKVVSYWLHIPMGEKIWQHPNSRQTIAFFSNAMLDVIRLIEAESYQKKTVACLPYV